MDMRGKFTTPGTCIHYYEVEWDPKDLSWGDFREKVLGGRALTRACHSEAYIDALYWARNLGGSPHNHHVHVMACY